MAKIHIPQVGDILELEANWNCKIFNEKRNESVFKALGIDLKDQEDTNIDITFLKGTVFKVTRLYVRAPASSYDSITLAVISSPIKSLAKTKFWVKIMDANQMDFVYKDFSFDNFNDISSLFRHLCLSDGHTTEKILDTEKQPYFEQILEHFKKDEKIISFDCTLNKLEIIDTYEFSEYGYYHLKELYRTEKEMPLNKPQKEDSDFGYSSQPYRDEKKIVLDTIPESVNITTLIYPVLNGYFYKMYSEPMSLVDQKLGYLNKIIKKYGRLKVLGSRLSYNQLKFLENPGKTHALTFFKAIEQNVDFNIGGDIKKVKNIKEINKIINSFLIKD